MNETQYEIRFLRPAEEDLTDIISYVVMTVQTWLKNFSAGSIEN